jgi:hypothetical protein
MGSIRYASGSLITRHSGMIAWKSSNSKLNIRKHHDEYQKRYLYQCRPWWRPPAIPKSSQSSWRAIPSAKRPTRSTSTATTSCPTLRARRKTAHARSSFTFRMTDPYERASITSNTYWDWWLERALLLVPAQAYVGNFLATFEEFPPRQKAASFTIDQVIKQMEDGWSAN